jgi:hypothetical protein
MLTFISCDNPEHIRDRAKLEEAALFGTRKPQLESVAFLITECSDNVSPENFSKSIFNLVERLSELLAPGRLFADMWRVRASTNAVALSLVAEHDVAFFLIAVDLLGL